MSSTDSANSERPLPEATQVVERWLDEHGPDDGKAILVSNIHRALEKQLSPQRLSEVLASLSGTGRLRRVYMVRLPNHQILTIFYQSVESIPEQIRAPLNETYSVDDVEVLPAYEIIGA